MNIINEIRKNPIIKTRLSLYGSIAANLMYAVLNIVFIILYHSAWFGIYAVYYTVLAGMRFILLRTGIGRSRLLELRRSRICAMILLSLNLSLSSAVLMILYQGRGFEYQGFLIYAVALYTFYITVHAIVEIIKYRRHRSPVLATAKIVNLSAALFSMLSLETAMLSQFGSDMTYESKYIFIALTGAGVSIILITMSIYTIIRTTKDLKKWKIKNLATHTLQRNRQK